MYLSLRGLSPEIDPDYPAIRNRLGDFDGRKSPAGSDIEYQVVRPNDFYTAILNAVKDPEQKQAAAKLYDDWVLGATGEPVSLDDLRGLLELFK